MSHLMLGLGSLAVATGVMTTQSWAQSNADHDRAKAAASRTNASSANEDQSESSRATTSNSSRDDSSNASDDQRTGAQRRTAFRPTDDSQSSQSRSSRSNSSSRRHDNDSDRTDSAQSRSNRDSDDDAMDDSERESSRSSRGSDDSDRSSRSRNSEQSRNADQSRSSDQNRRAFTSDQGGQRDMRSQMQQRRQQDQSSRSQNQQVDLGISWSDSDENDRLTIDQVHRGSLAAQSGFRQDDEIVSVNGRRVSSERELNRILSSAQRGTRMPVVVYRDGRQQTVFLTPNWQNQNQNWSSQQGYASQSSDQTSQRGQNQEGHAFLGVSLDDRYDNLAVVKQVFQNSPAQRAGLRAGDTISSLNGQRNSSAHELTEAVAELEPGASIQLQFSRPQAQSVQLRLGSRGDQGASNASYQQRSQDDSDDQGYQDRQDRSQERSNRSSSRSNSSSSSSDDDSSDNSHSDRDSDYGHS